MVVVGGENASFHFTTMQNNCKFSFVPLSALFRLSGFVVGIKNPSLLITTIPFKISNEQRTHNPYLYKVSILFDFRVERHIALTGIFCLRIKKKNNNNNVHEQERKSFLALATDMAYHILPVQKQPR